MLTATSFTVSMMSVQGVTLVVLRCRLGDEGNMTMLIRFKKGVVLSGLLISNYDQFQSHNKRSQIEN